MHLFYINILIFNFLCRLCASNSSAYKIAYNDACKTKYTITLYTYICLPENETPGLKHVEDIEKI
jgi:hypothetical protein